MKDERTGDLHDYTRKKGVEHSEILTPNGESIDRERLWNLAELAEKRKDGTPAREYEIALPDELNDKQRLKLARSFAEYLAGRHECAVDLAIHAPGKEGDHRNHHAHLLCTTRRFEPGGGLGEKCDVELSDRDRAKKGLPGRKAELDQARVHWERLANRALEKSGHTARIDHKSLEAQGVKRNPGTHIGATATAMERRGVSSERGGLYRELTQDSRPQAIMAIRAELTAAERVETGLIRVKDKVKNYQTTQARQRETERAKVAELARQREMEARAVELARQHEVDHANATKEAEIKAKREQEKNKELQKEKQKAEKSRGRSGPGMGR